MRRWGAPTENQVYADTAGNIGWVAGGLTPMRPNWDGLLPVPGDGRYEWDGFLAGDELPSSLQPRRRLVRLRQRDEPAGRLRKGKVGFEWADPTRAIRIQEVLGATPKGTLADSMALQTDTVSPQSRRGVALVAGLSSSDPKVCPRAQPAEDLGQQRDRPTAPRPRSTRSGRTSTWAAPPWPPPRQKPQGR